MMDFYEFLVEHGGDIPNMDMDAAYREYVEDELFREATKYETYYDPDEEYDEDDD